jgi:tRNA (cytidine/uridine-2'-O-)-methyltransferase
MFSIVLYEPEIPPNTGNIIRLAANTGVSLHLVKPLGFPLDDKRLIRAGLDYHEFASMKVHDDWHKCCTYFAGARLFALTTKAQSSVYDVTYLPDDVFVFGPETRGLPADVLASFPVQQKIKLPMQVHSRSLNLSNSVAVTIYEAWRQNGFQ